MRQAAGDRAVAQRRIAQCLGDRLRLLRRVDMRHHDAEPAAIEKPRSHPQLPGWHPHHRRDPDPERGDRDLHRHVEIHRIVLEIEKQPVVAGGLHDRRDIDGARLAQNDAERQLAGLEPLARGIAQGCRHGLAPSLYDLAGRF